LYLDPGGKKKGEHNIVFELGAEKEENSIEEEEEVVGVIVELLDEEDGNNDGFLKKFIID
jgi:hypothetical protein